MMRQVLRSPTPEANDQSDHLRSRQLPRRGRRGGGCSHQRLRPSARPTMAVFRKKSCGRRSPSAVASRSMPSPTNTETMRASGWQVFGQTEVTEPMYQSRSDCVRVVFWALHVFSVSRFHVPQGRSKIAQRFIAGLWREHKTSPVRDERTHRSSPIFSVAPPAAGALAILQSQPTVETVLSVVPIGTLGSLLFRRSTCPRPAALPHAMLPRKHPT